MNTTPSLEHYRRSPGLDWGTVWSTLERDGGVVVEDFVSHDLLARLQADFEPVITGHAAGSTSDGFWTSFHGAQTKRITGLPMHSPAWVELLCDGRYTELGDRYLGAGEYWLNTGQLICIGPGQTPQLLHRDELNWPHALRKDEITVTAIFALTDFTEANGATVIAPGSHRWTGVLPAVPEDSTCAAEMPAGSALLYSGKVMHGGGRNETEGEWRVGLHAGFCRAWLRAEENFQLTVPLEIARGLPARVQSLLGYRSYTPPSGVGARLGLVDYDDAARLLE